MKVFWLAILLQLIQHLDGLYERPPYGLLLNEIRIEAALPFIEVTTDDQIGSAGKDLSGYGLIILEFFLRALER